MYTPQQPYYNAHPQFPYPATQYPTQAPFASQEGHPQHRPGPSSAPYPQYAYGGAAGSQPTPGQPGSSSLACALDERAYVRYGSSPAHGFPDSEVVPYSPSPSSSAYESASPPECYAVDTDEDGFDDSIHPHGVPSDVMHDQHGLARPSYDEPSIASSTFGSALDPMSPSTGSTEFETDTEIGYFNGHRVPLGLVPDEYASISEYPMGSLTSVNTTYGILEQRGSPSLSVLTQASGHPPFLRNSRSYTLAEAITPIEEQRPRLNRSQNKIPDATSVPTSSIDVDAGLSPSVWRLDSSSQDDSPDHASGTGSATPSPPPSLPTPGPPRVKSPVKSQQGSTRPGSSTKAKTSASSAKPVDDIQTEPTGRPGESVIKLSVNVPREPKKKPIMACLFCRERKIACGHPAATDEDRRCNQCRRRDLDCVFPKECRRGQHKRISRLARVNATLNGEGSTLEELMAPQTKTPHMSASPGPSGPKFVGPSDTRERQKTSTKPQKVDVDAERRTMARLQRQMVGMQQRLGQR